jgi:RimJ/RimL family protein N-acetyltransferase
MLSLRSATRADETLLLEWRNDPSTRSSAFNDGVVSVEEHHAWLERKLADPASVILIAEEEGEPVAQVRFDRVDCGVAEIDISVARTSRGRGIGGKVIGLAVPEAVSLLGAKQVIARVKPNNKASLNLFAGAGFRRVSESESVVQLVLPFSHLTSDSFGSVA